TLFQRLRQDAKSRLRPASSAVNLPPGAAFSPSEHAEPEDMRVRRPYRLPAPVTSFIGREKEIAEVKELLSSRRLVTLIGTGGCGKTRLALQVADKLRNAFPEGCWFVELASLSSADLVMHAIASTLDVREQTDRPLIEVLLEYLEEKSLLIVLDNC